LTEDDITNQPRAVRHEPAYIKRYMGNRIMQEYKFYFEHYSWHNKHYAEATFHTVFGALMGPLVRFYMGGIYEDTRFHTHLFAPTSTGKSRAFSAAYRFAESVGLRFKDIGQATTAGLVGTIERDGQGKKEVVLGPIMEERGYDIIGLEEAGVLYAKNPPAHSEDTLKILQKSMNAVWTPENHISKDLASGSIQGYSPVSYLLATYPPATLSDIITRAGFLQRMFILYRVYGDEVRRMIEQTMIENMGNQNSLPNPNKYLRFPVAKLKHIKNYYLKKSVKTPDGRFYYPMDIDEKAKRYMFMVRDNIERKYQYSIGSVREEIANFRTRYIIQTMKLSCHYAMLRMSDKVEAKDVTMAQRLILPEFNNLIFFLESTLERTEMDEKMEDVWRKVLKIYLDYRKSKLEAIRKRLKKEKKKTAAKLELEEIYIEEGWMPRTLLVSMYARNHSCTEKFVNGSLARFELPLKANTKVEDLPKVLEKSPSARFIVARIKDAKYVKLVKGVSKMPTLIPHPEHLNKYVVWEGHKEEEGQDILPKGIEPIPPEEQESEGVI